MLRGLEEEVRPQGSIQQKNVAVARARLDALPLKQLRKLAADAGVDKEELMDALDESDDRKHTTLELLLRAIDEEPPPELGAEEGVPGSPPPPAEAPPPGAAAPAPPPSARREPDAQNPMSDMDILMAFYEAREPEHADAAWIAKVVRRYQKKAAKINVRAPEGTKFLLLPLPKPLLGESVLRMCVPQGARKWTGRS